MTSIGFVCDECYPPHPFKTSWNLKAHSLTHKKGDDSKPYKCETCRRRYSRKEGVKECLSKHQNNFLRCDKFGCDYVTVKKSNMKRHVLHTAHKFHCALCTDCERWFPSKRMRSNHIVKIHKSSTSTPVSPTRQEQPTEKTPSIKSASKRVSSEERSPLKSDHTMTKLSKPETPLDTPLRSSGQDDFSDIDLPPLVDTSSDDDTAPNSPLPKSICYDYGTFKKTFPTAPQNKLTLSFDYHINAVDITLGNPDDERKTIAAMCLESLRQPWLIEIPSQNNFWNGVQNQLAPERDDFFSQLKKESISWPTMKNEPFRTLPFR